MTAVPRPNPHALRDLQMGRIVNGTDVPAGKYPSMVNIIHVSNKYKLIMLLTITASLYILFHYVCIFLWCGLLKIKKNQR
jgi:hypothetical protein